MVAGCPSDEVTASSTSSTLVHEPTRPLRFIEMKPARQGDENRGRPALASNASEKAQNSEANTSRGSAPDKGSSSGQRNRRTPHKVIERVRRSRMNNEFAILEAKLPYPMKDAYKLDILQVNTPHRKIP